jgi:hypothetical protein
MPLFKFFLFRCVFEAIFKIKVSNVLFRKLYIFLRFSCVICMNFVAYYILFDLYGLVIYSNDLYGVFSGFICSISK